MIMHVCMHGHACMHAAAARRVVDEEDDLLRVEHSAAPEWLVRPPGRDAARLRRQGRAEMEERRKVGAMEGIGCKGGRVKGCVGRRVGG